MQASGTFGKRLKTYTAVATVRLEISDGGRSVVAGWEFDREMVSTHSPHQAAGNPV